MFVKNNGGIHMFTKKVISLTAVAALGFGIAYPLASTQTSNTPITQNVHAGSTSTFGSGKKSQNTKRIYVKKTTTLHVMVTPAKSGTYTFKVFKNGKTYKTYRGSGHQFKSFKAGKGGYSVRAYCNKSGQNFYGGISTSMF